MLDRRPTSHLIYPGLLLAALFGSAAGAAELTVDTLSDADNDSDDVCSLREAITAANYDADYNECAGLGYGEDTIRFSVGGTIILGSTLPAITDSARLTIDGTGQAVAVSGNDAVQVMRVDTGAVLALESLTVSDGYSGLGGGIENYGTLTVSNSTVSGNRAGGDIYEDGYGGGIYNGGDTLTVNNSTFSGNRAEGIRFSGDGYGGGIYNDGDTLTVSNSTFSGNKAGGGYTRGYGGGIYNAGDTLTVSNSTFSGNEASAMFGGSGGGIYNTYGTLAVSNSSFSDNQAWGPYGGGKGGGISNAGMLTVSNSTFSGNSALPYGRGGGIDNVGGTLTISNSTFSDNSAVGGGFGGNGSGGGIDNDGGTLTVSNSTFSGNSAEGGLPSSDCQLLMHACCRTCNRSSGGGISNGSNGTLELANTILANSLSGGDCYNAGTLIDSGVNLVEDGSCASDFPRRTDPLLGPLDDNGGPTHTMALL